MRQLLILLSIGTFLLGCDPSKRIYEAAEFTQLDTLEITAAAPPALKAEEDYIPPLYNPSYTRINDLLHTKLELSFDWPKEAVKGTAHLRFRPFFYPTNTLELDAKGFDIHAIRMKNRAKSLEYEYDGEKLVIQLDKMYTAMDEYELRIEYTAFPARLPVGGSRAITSDQGLFFINPRGEDPNKPQQIWTQGETEYNSRWFPTIDKPNERCSQEIYLTVQDRFKTLSNGLLVSSVSNGKGMRTDYWKMDQPHAPYLFMLAIGEFAVVEESWNGIPVTYYVEPEYEQDAKTIFAHTPEMLSFFSDLIDYPYPWDKYAQVVVRDYVSGAMENTTAVIFGDFVQAHAKELIDNHNDRIVAHEMFHHWFGDLVTCESWANLTMNEGFANYSEYLWLEHKYGKDEAEHAMRGDQEGYFDATSMGDIHPLIHFAHEDKEDMFDAHSYNKGGAVLHMLRLELGDEAFFAGLKRYLSENKYTAVEVHDLRLAMEDVSGRDLNWFFNQWYLGQGHPEVVIDHIYNEEKKQYNLVIHQQQDPDRNYAVFQLPLYVDIYIGKRMPIRKKIQVNRRKQTFTFDVAEKPLLVNVDAEKGMLWTKKDNRPGSSFVFQYYQAKNYRDKFESIDHVVRMQHPQRDEILEHALNDEFWVFRRKGIKELQIDPENSALWKKIAELAENDPDSRVRARALAKLAESGNTKFAKLLERSIRASRTYPEVSQALGALARLDAARAEHMAAALAKENNIYTVLGVAQAYAAIGDPKHLDYFLDKLPLFDGFDVFPFFEAFTEQASHIKKEETLTALVKQMKSMAANPSTPKWTRFSAARLIAVLADIQMESGKSELGKQYRETFEHIVQEEKDGQLRSIYSRL